MSFERLTKGDALAWIASLGLLFVTAIDWYSSLLGNAAREIQHDVTVPNGALGSEIPSTVQDQAKLVAQGQEKNLWQLHGGIDRLILIVLLATVVCATVAAILRVGAYRYQGGGNEPPEDRERGGGDRHGWRGLGGGGHQDPDAGQAGDQEDDVVDRHRLPCVASARAR